MTVLFWISSAFAATWTVGSSGADYTTIQDAIDNASTGDTIQVASGTYAESLDLSGLDLTITASSGASTTFLRPPNGQPAVQWLLSESGSLDGFTVEPTRARAFHIDGGGPTIQNCIVNQSGASGSLAMDGGGAYIESGSPIFSFVTFTESQGRYGGSIHAKGSAVVTLNDVTIDDSAGLYGGAIFGRVATFKINTLAINDPEAEKSGGAIYLDDATFEADALTIENPVGDETWGVGLFARNGSTLTLNNSVIKNASSAKYKSGYEGGGIRIEGTTTTLLTNGTRIEQATAYRGGAISLGTNTSATLVDTTFKDHSAHLSGGALFLDVGATVDCERCEFLDNSAPTGAGVYVSNTSSWNSTDSTWERNAATGSGGAAYILSPGDFNLSGDAFSTNTAEKGGALFFNTPNHAILLDPSFDGNQGTVSGGAIHADQSGILEIDNGQFENNSAADGGAIYADGLDSLLLDWMEARINTATHHGGAVFLNEVSESHLQRSLFISNGAGASGGAWYENDSSTFSKLQTTVWQENTAKDGGAIYITKGSSIEVLNNTLVGNAATGTGDHLALLSTPVQFINNIVAHGTGVGAIYGNTDTATASLFWYNDVWDNTTGHFTGDLSDPTGSNGNIEADPKFKAYTLDGNALNDDLHLQVGSPCIDTGWSAIKDVDGSNSDIGAFGGLNPRALDVDEDGFSDLVDCNDGDPSIYPGAPEVPYDGIDQDCDGLDWTDVDADGYDWEGVGGTDCNDEDPAIHPNATEIWYDGIDQNCDEASDYDQDQDGFDSDLHGGEDCNDLVPTIFPGATEVINDNIDQDCDGTDAIDADGDGYASTETGGSDCDDTRSEAYPGAEELRNDLDDDCDGFPETADRDGDGLPDYMEWAWNTDPLNPDSDGDTLLDGEEGEIDADPWDTDFDGSINPLDPDDDGDGIPTATETQLPEPDMDQDGTPAWLDTDTDGDGRSDSEEGTGDTDLDGLPDYADYDGAYTGGCVGGKSLLFFALLPLIARRGRRTSLAPLIVCLLVVHAPQTAWADGPDGHNLEWFNLAGHETGTYRVAHPNTMNVGLAIAGSLESAYQPLVEEGLTEPKLVIQNMHSLTVGVAFSPVYNLQIDALLPIHVDVNGTQGRRAGLGDARFTAKYALLKPKSKGLAMSAQALLWLPTGRAIVHHGTGQPAAGFLVAFGQELGAFQWSLNTGLRIGPDQTVRNITSSQGPLLGMAAQLNLPRDQRVFLELLSQGSSGWREWPVEVGAGFGIDTPKNTWSSFGLYVAPTPAAGVASWRIGLSGGWSKTKAPPAPPVEPTPVTPQQQPETKPAQPTISPKPAEIKEDRIIIHQQIQFEEGSAKLKDADNQPVLLAVFGILAEHPEIQHLLIIGHTNHHGTAEINQRLSEARAKTVLDWLVKQGVSPTRLLYRGLGDTQPKVEPNHPDSSRINRRVEFKVLRE